MSVAIDWHNTFIGSGIMMSTEEVIAGYQEQFSFCLMFRHSYESNICNDLICLHKKSSKSFGLLNIKTQDYIRLPAMTMECVGRFVRFWYALGFDPVNKVFKVLSIYDRRKGCSSKAAILTLGSKNWRPIEEECLPCSVTEDSCYFSSNNSFCLDGVIYWVNETYNIGLGSKMLTVVAFDLNSETFKDYELVVEDAGPFRYYLTSLKGCPTLFIWKKNDEIQQLTLFNHKNPNVAWKRRKFIVHDFPRIFNYGCRSNCVAGGRFLLHRLKPIGALREISAEVPEHVYWSWYILYDLGKFALE